MQQVAQRIISGCAKHIADILDSNSLTDADFENIGMLMALQHGARGEIIITGATSATPDRTYEPFYDERAMGQAIGTKAGASFFYPV